MTVFALDFIARQPLTCYIQMTWGSLRLYLADNRERFQKEAGNKSGASVSRLAGKKWKAATEAVKQPYKDKAAKLKEEYDAAMYKFKADGGVPGKRRADKAAANQDTEGGKRAKKEKDQNKPKKPQNSYWFWLRENRADLTKEAGGGGVAKVAKLAGEKWSALLESEKALFQKKALAARTDYEKAMAEYKKTCM